jgi:hypothetical protein
MALKLKIQKWQKKGNISGKLGDKIGSGGWI